MASTLNASTSSGLISSGDTSGVLQLQTANTTALTVDGSQNIGIGTTSIATIDVTGKTLEVYGGAGGGFAHFTNSTTGQTVGDGFIIGTSIGGSDALLIQRESANMIFRTADTERMRIDSSGNVGIGTTAPQQRLGIKPATNVPQLYLIQDNVANDGYKLFADSSAGYLSFLRTSSGSDTERMRIDSSGNVGIGTTTTSNATLTVNNANLTSPLYIGSQSDSLSWGGFFVNGATSSTSGNGIYGKSGASLYYNVATGLNHIWTVNGPEKMRLDSSGNLLVGTTTNLGSNGRLNVSYAYSNNGANWKSDSTITHNAISFNNPNGEVGTIRTSGSATSYNTSSDYRLKDNIVPMTGALAKVAQLKPVTYKWKVDNTQSQGFIAHELQEVVPECVTGTKDATREEEYEVTPAVKDKEGNTTTPAVMGTRTVPAYQGIDTSFLVATLTAALQETKALIDTQAETINALTARIVALEQA